MHPFLPTHVQREFKMPHSSHVQDWEFSEHITKRLLTSAPVAHFSFASMKGDAESRPSLLISQVAGAPHALAKGLIPPAHDEISTFLVEDFTTNPYPSGHLQGGSAILSFQSQCPFKAFATARLGAQRWEPAESGLSARQRGQMLHDVLHSIWSGHKPGIKSHR